MRPLRFFLLLLLLSAASLSSQPGRAQFTQQGPKLVGTGAVGGLVEQGYSVALSADGNTAIVGGNGDDRDAGYTFDVGAAWVYIRSGGVWTQQGAKLVGTGTAGSYVHQGTAVALSADGNTTIVGAPHDNSGVGAVWVFTRSGGMWTQQGAKLVGTDAVGSANQGQSVALSADGNSATVGGPQDNSGVGAVWVFTRSGGVWTQQGAKLVGTDAVGSANQGQSVALSADGSTAIAGGALDNLSAGAAWVYTRIAGVWTQQSAKLVGTGAVYAPIAVGPVEQGVSVALSADGATAIVGGPGDYPIGAAWVFTRSGGAWTQQGAKLVGTRAVGFSHQGVSVALSGDGNTAVVGGAADNPVGAAWVFTRSRGMWTQQGAKLVGAGAVGSSVNQGSSVALSSDGSTAIVGGPGDNSGASGAAWVYARAAVTQTQTAVEYYYAAWNYYFVTSFPDEIAALDAGAFGGLWQRTGQTFNVWAQPDASNSPTCRFFSTVFAPKSSHFYTPLPNECAIVKTEPAWQYEAIAFYLQLPTGYGTGNGFCPPGTTALYRLYNNGMGGAPNHRYTTSLATLNAMLAQGWVFEGEANTQVFACVAQ